MFDFFEKHLGKFVGGTTILSSVNFVTLLVSSLSDGIITDEELHALIQASSGIQVVVLVVIMAFLKSRNDK